MLVNDKLEWMWNEDAMVHLKKCTSIYQVYSMNYDTSE
jgi:hypothetical protein